MQQNPSGFDKNAIIGLTLIFLILMGFGYWQSLQQEKQAPEQANEVTSGEVEPGASSSAEPANAPEEDTAYRAPAASADTAATGQKPMVLNTPKIFQPFMQGEDETYTLENEVFKIYISRQGGHISRIVLKKYQDYKGNPVELISPERQQFSYLFNVQNKTVSTEDLYFRPQEDAFTIKGDEERSFSLQVPLSDGQYLEHRYTLQGNSYVVDYDFKMKGFDKLVPRNSNFIRLDWKQQLARQEQSIEKEREATTLYYKYVNDSPDDLSSGDEKDEEILEYDLQWVAHKQQFFTQSLIAKEGTVLDGGEVKLTMNEDQVFPLKTMHTTLTLPFDHKAEQQYNLQFFVGPNDHNLLADLGMDFTDLLPLGWGIFGWVNQYLIIPVFDYLDGRIASYGIIILILTFLIKLITFPFTYKSFLSSARMRLLKPEMDKIKEKVGNDPQKQQQEQLKLYQRTGINPLGGCLPILFQMPFLIAMFRFFPASIELRNESFLWANDLSTYDSIWDFGYVPLINTLYGDHVSLFALLMAISVMIYTIINQQNTPTGAGQPEFMKYFPYIMPVMLIGFFNNMPAALCYYYFMYNIFSFAQTWGFRRMVNEDKLRAKLEAKKTKQPGKKSGFQKRLENMTKTAEEARKQQQQQQAPNRGARRRR